MTVYVQLPCHSGYSPLHSALGVEVFHISLFVPCIHDHITGVSTLYQGEIPAKDTRPTSKSLLRAGVLRGLWETDSEADVRDLDIYHPDQSLVKSFRAPPATFSNEVVIVFSKLPNFIPPRPDDFLTLPRHRISPRDHSLRQHSA